MFGCSQARLVVRRVQLGIDVPLVAAGPSRLIDRAIEGSERRLLVTDWLPVVLVLEFGHDIGVRLVEKGDKAAYFLPSRTTQALEALKGVGPRGILPGKGKKVARVIPGHTCGKCRISL